LIILYCFDKNLSVLCNSLALLWLLIVVIG
jgi:hypothetical protein